MSDGKTRDHGGRWIKGVSGNNKGRPSKFARIDHGDIQIFKNALMEVKTAEGRIMMTREGAVLHRLWQSAMNGSVHAQIHLNRRFDKYQESQAKILAGTQQMILDARNENRPLNQWELGYIKMAKAHFERIPGVEDGLRPPKKLRSRRRNKKSAQQG
jgi:hypothetical protein